MTELTIVPTKPDAEVAAELKARVAEALKPLLAIMDEALGRNLQIVFSIGPSGIPPRHVINSLEVVKKY